MSRGSSGGELGTAQLTAGDARSLVGAREIAIVASWGPTPRLSRSAAELVSALHRGGFRTVLVRSGDVMADLEWPIPAPADVVVVQRPNLGYDFGSWAAAIQLLPAASRADNLLLANDSLLGPFADIGPLLEDFRTRDCDIWGAVQNPQFFPHLQSFLFGFRNGTAAHPAIRRFWRTVRHLDDKDQIIVRYELGLNRLAYEEGFVSGSPNGLPSLGYGVVNHTLDNWSRLLDRGFPFVKRALIADGLDTPVARTIRSQVADRYEHRLEEWI